MGHVTIFSGAERRRRWSEAEKRELLARAFAPGAVVAQVALVVDVHPSQLYRWRAELRGGVAKPDNAFVRVVMTSDAPAAVAGCAIQVRLGNAFVDVADHAPAALVTATLKALAR